MLSALEVSAVPVEKRIGKKQQDQLSIQKHITLYIHTCVRSRLHRGGGIVSSSMFYRVSHNVGIYNVGTSLLFLHWFLKPSYLYDHNQSLYNASLPFQVQTIVEFLSLIFCKNQLVGILVYVTHGCYCYCYCSFWFAFAQQMMI